jgi:hypothetical protein
VSETDTVLGTGWTAVKWGIWTDSIFSFIDVLDNSKGLIIKPAPKYKKLTESLYIYIYIYNICRLDLLQDQKFRHFLNYVEMHHTLANRINRERTSIQNNNNNNSHVVSLTTKSTDSSKASSPQTTIYCFPFQVTVSFLLNAVETL